MQLVKSPHNAAASHLERAEAASGSLRPCYKVRRCARAGCARCISCGNCSDDKAACDSSPEQEVRLGAAGATRTSRSHECATCSHSPSLSISSGTRQRGVFRAAGFLRWMRLVAAAQVSAAPITPAAVGDAQTPARTRRADSLASTCRAGALGVAAAVHRQRPWAPCRRR